ncbi:MAG: DUF1295 domain-containing protein [Clostridia bacterium]|nr:DUF1295 domain-containing protein [Clostridia bacterium]
MKKYVGTALTSLIVLGLIAVCFVQPGAGWSELQRETLKTLVILCLSSVAYCFIVGELAQNFSQMDKLWSVLPVAYTWIIAVRGGMKLRLVLYAVIVTLWGIRLTVNFARKGAYSLKFWQGEEDYRWSIVRQNPLFRSRFAWALFDLFFISLYQNALVLGICLPALACMDSLQPLGEWDYIAAGAAVFFLLLETVADEVQWKFHQQKKKLLREKGALADLPAPYDLGFNTLGIWGVMRHPNYLGEQGVWMSLYFFAVGAGVSSAGFHITAIGPLLLILLFMGSSALGENISGKKYPLYRAYTEQVAKYLPLRRFDPALAGQAAEEAAEVQA